MKKSVLLLLLALFSSSVFGAVLSGTAYTQDLQIAKYSLLTINTTPTQRILLINGTYNMTVPNGEYLLEVRATVDGQRLEDRFVIVAKDTKTYSYDFILLPLDEEVVDTVPQDEDDLLFPELPQERGMSVWPFVLGMVVLGLVAVVAINHKKVGKATPSQETIAIDLQTILDLLKKDGGRTTQKELCKHIPVSEAKLSMMLTELESKGKIQKFKKGRGNIIVKR